MKVECQHILFDGTSKIDVSDVAIIIVTYNPDIKILATQLEQLPRGATKVIVDNASQRENREQIRRLFVNQPRLYFIENETNIGLASALNQGARYGQHMLPICRYFLLLDQDTEPGKEGVSRLLGSYEHLTRQGARVGCVGPRLLDAATGLDHGFHQMTAWRWIRYFSSPESRDPILCANLNGSGTLVSVEVFNALGGLDEKLFIDHVDTDWSFRLLAAGYALYGIPEVTFLHRMGERSLRFWFSHWRIWPSRSPERHYFLFRNAIWLMQRNYVPRIWKIWAVPKLIITMLVHLIIDPQRWKQLRNMFRGIQDGLKIV